MPDFLKFGGLKRKLLKNGHFNEVSFNLSRDTPEQGICFNLNHSKCI